MKKLVSRSTSLVLFFPLLICIWSCKNEVIQEKPPISKNDFSAKWITAQTAQQAFDTTYAAPYFRKEFEITSPIKSATAKVTGVGYYEFYLNGNKVGDHLLAPAFTRYDKRVNYELFDVSDYLTEGKNAAASIIGNGFYNVDTRSAWRFSKAPWRNSQAFICQIDIIYENGQTASIITDDSWKYSNGAIVFDQIRNGETYDANKELKGWAKTGFDDSAWQKVALGNGPKGELTEETMPPMRKTKTLQPVTIKEPSAGVYVVDFGQNISGWAKININEEAGKEVVMRYAERIFEDGNLDNKELARFVFSGETQTTRYISNGNPNQTYEPRFAYFGFQYIEITGLSEPLEATDIEAYMINTDFEEVGYFESSNELFNQIHKNIKWSYLGNYHGFPEDCPHREKAGWTGDAQLVVETGLFNYDVLSAYLKWMQDHADEQRPNGDLPGIIPTSGWGYDRGRDSATRPYGYGPQWEGSSIVIPWHLYRHTGDKAILERFYPMMTKYLGHLENISNNYLLDIGIDDHKSIETHTEGGYISSAYFHWLSGIMAQCAEILSKGEDKTKYDALATNVAKAFHAKYFNKESNTYGNGGQTQMALPLASGIVPNDLKEVVFESLLTEIERKNYHFDCGVVGLRKLIDVLIAYDRKDVLYKIANQKDFPSFGYWLELGANTMWQNWDGSQSHNHIMFGSIGDYFYQGLAGIQAVTSEPGFKKINVSPQFPNDMTFLKCGHKTQHGWINTEWKKEDKNIAYQLTVPTGSEVFFTIPKGWKIASGLEVTENEGNLNLPAGNYNLLLESN